MMDLFQHRYYRLSKILLTLIGQWPYQNIYVKRACLVVLIFLGISIFASSLVAIAKYPDDSTILLKVTFLYVGGVICFVKLLGLIVHSQKTIKLINRTRTDWEVWARDREVNILHGFAERGKKLTILYTGIIYTCVFIFMMQPVIPKIIDIVLRNGSQTGKFPLPLAYYHLNEQKYYFYLIMYTNICVYVLMTPLVSNDVMLIIYVQHVCGILVALGHKLERIGNNERSVDPGKKPNPLNKSDMAHLTSCINRHNDAIEYANLIEASYTRTFFVTVGLGIIMINTSGLQILITINDPATVTGMLFFVLGIMFYFYMECYISQILTDHSISIRFYIYNSQWYRLSPKTQKIVQFMTMRCSVPCQLTVGKMMILSMRNFWMVLKTTISYFRFLSSTQGW